MRRQSDVFFAPGLLLAPALALLGGCETGRAAPALALAADSASNPTVAYDARDGTAYVAWVGSDGGEHAVFVARLDPAAGAPPATPVRANDIPGDAAPHRQAPAQVALGPEGNVYVLWQNNTPVEGRRFPASDLRLAVSRDGGRSFLAAVTVNDDAGGPPSSHTFHDMAVGSDGTVYVSWIDSRERDAAAHQRMPSGVATGTPGSGGHAHPLPTAGEGRGMPLEVSHRHFPDAHPAGPDIRIARSRDGGRTFEPSVVVDSNACPCCRTSLVVGSDGAVYVGWRKIFPGDVRDIVVARADPGELQFAAPVRVHEDAWVFPGCPHAGPSLALDEEGRVLVGWYTGKQGRQGLWYAASSDRGRTFGAPVAVLTAEWVPPSQLRLASSEGSVWAAWDDRTGDHPVVRAARGSLGEPLRTIDAVELPGSDPALATAGSDALLAWLDGSAARAIWIGQ